MSLEACHMMTCNHLQEIFSDEDDVYISYQKTKCRLNKVNVLLH